MINRNQLKDVSIHHVMEEIEDTSKEDMIIDMNRIRLTSAESGETRINAEFEGMSRPVKQVALTQIENSLLPGFSAFGRNLINTGMRDLYLDNANRLLSRNEQKKMIRMSRKTSGASEMSLRGWLSTSYQQYDDDVVFGAMIDAIEDTPEAIDFQSIGGYRTDSTSYMLKECIFNLKR